jgi:hypothetical protein
VSYETVRRWALKFGPFNYPHLRSEHRSSLQDVARA